MSNVITDFGKPSIREIKERYYDPSYGLLSPLKFYMKYKKDNPDIKLKEILNILQNQEVLQVTHKPTKSYDYKIYSQPRSFQVDIIYLKDYEFKGHDKVLTFIDINTRRVWMYLLKTKKLEEILEKFKEFLKEVKDVYLVMGDNEFNKKEIISFLEKHKVKHSFIIAKDEHIVKQGNKLGIIDRFARTFRALILRHILGNKTKDWVSVLPQLIENYNNTPHRSLNYMTPNEFWKDTDLQMEYMAKTAELNRAIQDAQHYNVGDRVRIVKPKTVFDKEGQTFTDKIYVIIDRNGHRYRIADEDKKINSKEFKYNELFLVKETPEENTGQIVQVIKEAKKERQTKRKLRKEGIDEANIITEKRVRKENKRFKD